MESSTQNSGHSHRDIIVVSATEDIIVVSATELCGLSHGDMWSLARKTNNSS